MLSVPRFWLIIIFVVHVGMQCMEERPNRALSNADVDEIKFVRHWLDYEEKALAIIKLQKILKEKVTIEDPKRGKLGIFDPNDGDGSVEVLFDSGALKLSYAAFVLRIKNNDNPELKPLDYYQQLPTRNGLRFDKPPEQSFLTIYQNLEGLIGSPETQGEHDYLLEKKPRKCWCCNLY